MSRLPESRLLANRAVEKESAQRIFKTADKEFGSDIQRRLFSLHIGDTIPSKTKSLANWPKSLNVHCLHCAELIEQTPLPAVKYYESQEDKYWVYGYFCRPCCSLAYVKEQQSTDVTRCLIWTQNLLRNFFGYKISEMRPAPPRCTMEKFGGSLSLKEFYGECGTVFKSLISPPFATFAMYAEITKLPLSQDNNKTKGLRRPTEIRDPVENEITEKPPLILEYLARRGVQSESKEELPPKKRSKINTPQKINEDVRGDEGGLAKYLIKKK